jgi:broad specificity polyphosphatase/5'/3'-nucleotidase SurE
MVVAGINCGPGFNKSSGATSTTVESATTAAATGYK